MPVNDRATFPSHSSHERVAESRDTRAMNAEQFLALADTLRSFAQHSGRDLNASNLFVHDMLMRAIQREPVELEHDADECRAA